MMRDRIIETLRAHRFDSRGCTCGRWDRMDLNDPVSRRTAFDGHLADQLMAVHTFGQNAVDRTQVPGPVPLAERDEAAFVLDQDQDIR